MTRDLQGSRACRPEATHRRRGRGARCGRASRRDPCRNPFHRRTCPETPWIAGVVAWIELASPSVEEEVAALPRSRPSRAFGPCGTTTGASPGCSTAGWSEAFRRCRIMPSHSISWCRTGGKSPWRRCSPKRWPGLAIVLDHCGKPDIAGGRFDPWARHIEELASRAARRLQALRVVELRWARSGPSGRGGLYEPGSKSVRSEQGHVGERLAALDLASDYATWKRTSDMMLQSLPKSQQIDVMAGTAARVYRLNS